MRSDALDLLTRLLRLAVLLNRGRMPMELPPMQLKLTNNADMTLEIPQCWLEHHPLTEADLEQEIDLLTAVGKSLVVAKT